MHFYIFIDAKNLNKKHFFGEKLKLIKITFKNTCLVMEENFK